MELCDDAILHLAVEDLLVGALLLEVEVKPRLEGVEVVEDGGEQKVEERPQLREVVLQRGAGEEEAVRQGVRRCEKAGIWGDVRCPPAAGCR